MPVISKGPTVYEVTYDLLREALHGVLSTVVESGPCAEHGKGSVPWRACAALYWLVQGHPVDRRGRCRSCRRPGAVLGRARRRCQVRVTACFWLHQPDQALLLDLLAHELNQQPPPSVGTAEPADRCSPDKATPAADPDITDVLPRFDREHEDPHTPTAQSPAVSRPPLPGGDSPEARRPASDHGGTVDGPRPRRDPPDGPSSPADEPDTRN